MRPKKHLQQALNFFMVVGMMLSSFGAGILPSAQAASTGMKPDRAALAQPANEVQAFSPMSPTDGWILTNGHLYSTSNNGDTWNDITPPLSSTATIYAVKFLDVKRGRLLWANNDADGNLVFLIDYTIDRGSTWTSSQVQTISPDDPNFYVDKASMGWLNENTGWVSVKQMTGSNFSSGTLFRTDDAGQTWRRYSLPIGGPVYFVDDRVGWMAGGPAGNQLFRTRDGGSTWEEQPIPAGIDPGQVYTIYPPIFDSPDNGLITVIKQIEQTFQVAFFSTTDGGLNWMPITDLPLDPQTGALPQSLLDSRNLVATIPNDNRVIHMVNGEVKTAANQDGLSAAIVDLLMISSDYGWAKWNTGTCETTSATGGSGSTNISCTKVTKLLRTMDGGLTWEKLTLPVSATDTLTQSMSTAASIEPVIQTSSPNNTLTLIGQGFDKCEIPNLTWLQTWWNESPYRAVNLYIGGIARACPNAALTADYVNLMRRQGWSFIPTWVGPQAPCWTGTSDPTKKIGKDPLYAFEQGEDEADAAVATLAALGLTLADQSGSIVYYDMEAYPALTDCRAAVNAFVNGWVSRLHTHGNLAGMYASTLKDSGLVDFLTIPNIPDTIWPPRWYHNAGFGSYDPTASVWNLGAYVPDTVWTQHKRIRQYEGDHNETWGGVTISSIDNNVLDGLVAVPFQGDPSEDFSASPLSGDGPLSVIFHLTNTAFMNSCRWDYGDGQAGTSCATNHSHTYTTPGIYSVTFSVTGPGGIGNMVRSNYIKVTQPASFPDLVPKPRPGESSPVVLSSLTGTTGNNSLNAGQPVFIDWGIKNDSAVDIPAAFSVDLFINDQPFIEHTYAGLSAGASAGFDDWKITWNTAGCYPVKLVVDFYGNVAESNESNNSWTNQYCWQSNNLAGPGLIPVAPSGVITETNPTFTWNPVTNASSYDLHVYSIGANNTLDITGISPASYCVESLCSYPISTALSGGDYQFKVGMKDQNNNTTYSPWMTFTEGGAPTAPGSLGPTDMVMVTKPSFTWNKSAGASWYDLYVYPGGLSIPIVSAISIPASSICAESTCSWTPSRDLPGAYYVYNVRAGNLAGTSSFSPSQKFTISMENTSRFISGNAGVAGTILSYRDGSTRNVQADGSGNYLIAVSDNWSGKVTPAKMGYVFTPAETTYTGVTTNQANWNYSAVYTTHVISGNAGMGGVTLTYLDGTLQTIGTDAAGSYSFAVPHGWSGTVTPSRNGYVFTPVNHSYTNISTGQSGQDFIIHLIRKYFLPLTVKP